MTAARSSGQGRLRHLLDALTSVILIGAALYVVYRSLTVEELGGIPIPKSPLAIAGSSGRGSQTAPIVMIAFSDFECPFCARFATETLPEIDREYLGPGRLQVVFRHLPLPNHRNAIPAGVAAECAGEQDRFWPMHDRLFALRAKGLTPERIRGLSKEIGLDIDKFDACLASDVAAKLKSDADVAALLGIQGTPGFLIGRRLSDGRVKVVRTLAGAQPIRKFRDSVEAVTWELRLLFAARVGAVGLALGGAAAAVVILSRRKRRRVTAAAS